MSYNAEIAASLKATISAIVADPTRVFDPDPEDTNEETWPARFAITSDPSGPSGPNGLIHGWIVAWRSGEAFEAKYQGTAENRWNFEVKAIYSKDSQAQILSFSDYLEAVIDAFSPKQKINLSGGKHATATRVGFQISEKSPQPGILLQFAQLTVTVEFRKGLVPC